MAPLARTEAELLLAHGAWIRSLARRLVADEHRAEDLAQDTWLAALRHPWLGSVRAPRRWLSGILANLSRQDARGRSRREARESTAAREPVAPSASDTFEAASLGRELADAVLALEEPFRTAVLLRYYEDLPPRRIATRLGVPVRTVNSRLARGLERLRAQARLRLGGERSWMQALVLLARRSSSPGAALAPAPVGSALTLGVSLMNAKLVMVAAAVGCGALAWVWTSLPAADTTRAAQPAAISKPGESSSTAVPESAVAAATQEPARQAVEGTSQALAVEPDPAIAPAATRRILGRVCDTQATPLAGIEVVFRTPGADSAEDGVRAVTGPGGTFELETPRADGRVTTTEPDLVTVSIGIVRASTEVGPLVIVASRRDLAGRVVDVHGAPLAGAHVALRPPAGFLSRFDALLDSTEMLESNAHSDARGRFELPGAPAIHQGRIEARLDGFETESLEAPSGSDLDLVIELSRPQGEGLALSGIVLDLSARPVAGAFVSLGGRTAVTDVAGEFRLETEGAEDSFDLVALHPDFQPGRLRASQNTADGRPVWPDVIVLTLGGPPLTIAGRVVDGQGEPRAGVRLWVEDPTPFGILGEDLHAKVEYLLTAEEGTSDGNWRATWTDAEGRFRVGGLLKRSYHLRMMDGGTLEAHSAGPFDAGDQEVEIVFPRAERGRVAGRVVSVAGRPVAGVSLALLGHAHGGIWNHLESGDQVTDAEGRFAFEGVGGRGLQIWLRGDDVIPTMIAVGDRPQDRELEIAVSVRCHFKVDLGANPGRADGLKVLGPQDEVLDLVEVGPGGVTIFRSAPLVEGRSTSLGVDERARTLVLEKGGVEVQRIPLQLVPGRLNRIEL